MLSTPADLRRWVRQSGLADDPEPMTDDDLRRAIAVREALFGLLAALIDGTAPPAAARDLVNATAAHPGPPVHLDGDGRVRRGGDLAAVLAVLARQVIELHDSPDRPRLRWCDDARCTRPFIDRSRGQARRWCGMRGCGDRAKAAAYRRRRRAIQ
jgi:predicted RNA-binding Zn ribbon-like protein